MKELILKFLGERKYQFKSIEPKDEDFTILVFGFNQNEQVEFTLDTVYHEDLVDVFELLDNGACVHIDAKEMPTEEIQVLNCLYGILHYQNFDKQTGSHSKIGQLIVEVTQEQSKIQTAIYDKVFCSFAEHAEKNFLGKNVEMTKLLLNLQENCVVLIPFCLLTLMVEVDGEVGLLEPMINYLHHEDLIYCLDYIDKHTSIETDRKFDSVIIEKYKNFIKSYTFYLEDDRANINRAIEIIS